MKLVRLTHVCRECNCEEFYWDGEDIYHCKDCGYPNVIGDMWDCYKEIKEVK